MAASHGCAVARNVTEGAGAAQFVYSPYKYVPLGLQAESVTLATVIRGRSLPIVVDGRSMLPDGVAALTLAFATGECGAETWEGLDGDRLAPALRTLDHANIGYIVATGGAGGVFTCQTDAGMEAFIARYDSPRLVGIDFDIEGKQTPEMIDALVQRAATVQRKHPHLRLSFTLATLAASDGSRASVNVLGQSVLRTIRAHGLASYTINLMVMDYGQPLASNCVVANGVCDMGRSAIQAAENLNALHGIALSQIELTPMLGVNDVAQNDLLVDDARVIARYVANKGLAGVRFWSLDRDQPCQRPPSGASPRCSGLEGVPALGYSAAFDPSRR